MRIKVNFSANTSLVPNNGKVILEYVHRCLGRDNEYHDKASSYSISQLYGGEISKEDSNCLNFPNGGYFTVSSQDKDFVNNYLLGLINNPEISYGMKFKNLEHIKEMFMDGWNHFATLSPFVIKVIYGKGEYGFHTLEGEYKRVDGKWQNCNDSDYNFEDVVKKYLINKLKKINDTIDLSDFNVKIDEFDENKVKHNKHKVKKVLVKNVLNFANQCQMSIFCSRGVAEMLYNIGIGQSTGAGFGTIYKTENHHIYRSGKAKLQNSKTKLENKKAELLSEIA